VMLVPPFEFGGDEPVARTVAAHAGMTVRAVTDTMRTQSIEAMRDRCRAELAR